MPKIHIRRAGALGFIPDVPSHELPPEAWSVASNVGFEDGYAFRELGETAVEGTPSVTPYYLFPSASTTSSYWVYTDLQSVYAVAGGVHTDITRVAGIYTGQIDDVWTGYWLNGVMILNNGINDPQEWRPITVGTKLATLTNWPANTKCKVMRGFQNFLIALDVTKSSVRYPTMVKWSHPADPGSVPVTWDPADATRLAGELPLSDTPGFIVDGAPLGRSFMVYKEDAVFRLDRVATNAVFAQQGISLRTGIMGIDCAKQFSPGMHLVLTLDADLAVTDGQRLTSITNKRVRKYLEQFISGEFRSRCFIVTDVATKEAYVCFPKVGSTYCDQAMVWNWEDDTWARKDITETLDIKAGIYDESALAESWDVDTEAWDSDLTSWDERGFVASGYKLLGAFPTGPRLAEFGRGQSREGTTYTSVLERTGLAIAGVDRSGAPIVDQNKVKQVTEVYPVINTPSPATFKISVGAQDNPNSPITWDGPYDFNPLVDEKIDCFVEGRYIGIRFESDSMVPWKMQGYAVNVNLVGEYF